MTRFPFVGFIGRLLLALLALSGALPAGGALLDVRDGAPARRTLASTDRARRSAVPPTTCDGDWTSITCGWTETAYPNQFGRSATYVVYNNAAYDETYDFTCSVVAPVSACTPPARVTILANGSADVTVQYSTGATVGNGTVTLAATSWNYGETVNAPITVAVAPAPPLAAVTPDGQAQALTRSGVLQSLTFAVRDTGSSSADTLNLRAACGGTPRCIGASPDRLVLAAGQSGNATVSFYGDVVGSGTVRLIATSNTDAVVDSGYYNVSVRQICAGSRAILSCEWQENAPLDAADAKLVFELTNTSQPAGSWEEYSFTCQAEFPVLNCVPPANIRVNSGDSATVTVTYATGSYPGMGSVTLTAHAINFGEDVAGTADFSVGGAFTRSRLVVPALVSQRQFRPACPVVGAGANSASECSDLVYAHAFPAYRSLSRPHAMTLLYNSATAHPEPAVVVNYLTYPDDSAQEFLVTVKELAPTATLLDSVYFDTTGYSNASRQWHRFVVPIDAAAMGLSTGSYPIEVAVQVKTGGVWDAEPAIVQTQLLVVDRRRSPFGAGWWPAGIERLYPGQPDSSALLVLADGSALRYARVNGRYISPPGDHSTLSTLKGGGGFQRVPLDGRDTVVYDSEGFPISVSTTAGNIVRYYWTTGGPDTKRLDSIVDPVGQVVRLTTSGTTGHVTNISIPGLNPVSLGQTMVTSSEYDLSTVTDPDGYVTRFAYGTGTHLMSTSTARGTATFTYWYDPLSRLDSVTPPAGGITRHFRPWQLVGAKLAATSESTPAHGSMVDSAATVVTWPTLVGTAAASFTVGSLGSPIRVATPLMPVTAIQRDTADQPLIVSNTAGAYVSEFWDANGKLTTMVQRVTGREPSPGATYDDTTRYEYNDPWYSLSKITPPDGIGVMTFTYDAEGNLQDVRDGRNRRTHFDYTTHGLPYRIWEPDPADTTGAGNLETHPTTFAYDSGGGQKGNGSFNLVSVTKGLSTTTYVYDDTNHSDVVAVVDPVGDTTTYQYDAIKRTIGIDRAGQSTISYRYDDSARTRTMTDPDGLETTWSYDGVGHLLETCYPSGCDALEYEDGMNPTIVELRDGTWIWQNYDLAGRITKKLIGSPADDSVLYAYDSTGTETTITNSHATVFTRTDPYGRVTCEEEDIRYYKDPTRAGGADAWFRYDAGGRLKTMIIGTGGCSSAPPAGDSVLYSYDLAGSLISMGNTYWDVGNETWRWTNDAKGRPIKLAIPTTTAGAQDLTWSYDVYDRMRKYTEGAGYADSITVFDSLGRVREQWGGYWTGPRRYTYDALGRLQTTSALGDQGNDSFTYDAAGNRLTDTTWAYTYDPATERLATKTQRPEHGTCAVVYHYDLRGNEESKAQQSGGCLGISLRTLTYDHAGQMVSSVTTVQKTTGTITENREFWYDGLGRRVMMRSTNDSATDNGTWRYFWFGDQVGVKTYNVNDTTQPPGGPAYVDWYWPRLVRGSGGALDSTTLNAGEWFFYGPGTDNILASWDFNKKFVNPTRRLFVKDYRGSVIDVTNQSNTSLGVTADQYTAFGAPVSGTSEGTAGYNGAEAAGGLVYLRNRWYDPNTGRFTQEDPIGFAGGINLYAYAGNDPITFADPFGLQAGCPDSSAGGTDSQADGHKDCAAESAPCYLNADSQADGYKACNPDDPQLKKLINDLQQKQANTFRKNALAAYSVGGAIKIVAKRLAIRGTIAYVAAGEKAEVAKQFLNGALQGATSGSPPSLPSANTPPSAQAAWLAGYIFGQKLTSGWP